MALRSRTPSPPWRSTVGGRALHSSSSSSVRCTSSYAAPAAARSTRVAERGRGRRRRGPVHRLVGGATVAQRHPHLPGYDDVAGVARARAARGPAAARPGWPASARRTWARAAWVMPSEPERSRWSSIDAGVLVDARRPGRPPGRRRAAGRRASRRSVARSPLERRPRSVRSAATRSGPAEPSSWSTAGPRPLICVPRVSLTALTTRRSSSSPHSRTRSRSRATARSVGRGVGVDDRDERVARARAPSATAASSVTAGAGRGCPGRAAPTLACWRARPAGRSRGAPGWPGRAGPPAAPSAARPTSRGAGRRGCGGRPRSSAPRYRRG